MSIIIIMFGLITLTLETVHSLEGGPTLIFKLKSSNTIEVHHNQIVQVVREEKIKFILYTRKNPNGYRLMRNNVKNLRNSSFNNYNPTKIIIHGYLNTYSSDAVQIPKNAYLSTGNFNVIAVDWSEYAFPYVVASNSARAVGHITGSMISFLMDKGRLKTSDLHIIGHSLGSHVAGYAVEKIKSKPFRITGLDPAAPMFSGKPPSERLGEEDAEFVDVIHTSVRVLGMTQNIGHVDFYPAGGKHQPRCPKDIVEEVIGTCDHGQSYMYFAESILNKNQFPAVKCRSLPEALEKRCRGKKTALMGEYATYRNPRGIFYVHINSTRRYQKLTDYFPVVRYSGKNLIINLSLFKK